MLQFVLDFLHFFFFHQLLGLMTVLTDSRVLLFCHCDYFTGKNTPRSCWAANIFQSITKTKQTRSRLHVKICCFSLLFIDLGCSRKTKSVRRVVFVSKRFAKGNANTCKDANWSQAERFLWWPNILPSKAASVYSFNIYKSKYLVVFQSGQAFFDALKKWWICRSHFSVKCLFGFLSLSSCILLFSVVRRPPRLLPALTCSTCVCLPSLLSPRQRKRCSIFFLFL